MKFMLLVYTDTALVDALPEGEMEGMLRTCFDHVDELERDGCLIESRMLEGPRAAKSVRLRNDRVTATDGPFSEAKEVLGGFNLIEARDMDEAVRIAAAFPWTRRVHRGPPGAGPPGCPAPGPGGWSRGQLTTAA